VHNKKKARLKSFIFASDRVNEAKQKTEKENYRSPFTDSASSENKTVETFK